jgi:hypothetical protein
VKGDEVHYDSKTGLARDWFDDSSNRAHGSGGHGDAEWT